MAICSVCGNDYDKAFTVTRNGQSAIFDSLECAANALAPSCGHCGCRVLGHGVEEESRIYCCAHCARQEGGKLVRDRA